MTQREKIEKLAFSIAHTAVQNRDDLEAFVKDVEKSVTQIETLITEGKIEELDNFTYAGASKWEIDKRIAELQALLEGKV